jgi:hypothetical protein
MTDAEFGALLDIRSALKKIADNQRSAHKWRIFWSLFALTSIVVRAMLKSYGG